MTQLMQRVLRRLSAVPESAQDRVARRVLDLPELGDLAPPVSLGAVARDVSVPTLPAAHLDRRLDALRDEWGS